MPLDETEFAQFYRRHVDTVYRICFIRMKNQMDAEDLTQETFLRAMQQPELWQDDDRAKAWLVVTASNLCKNALRHWSRTQREDVADWEAVFGTSDPPGELSATLTAVMELPDPYKTVLYLFYYEAYSGAEIAGILGKKESTVRSLLHRGRRMLSKSLGGEPYAEAK